MSAFSELDWRRPDVRAIVGGSGLAVIELEQRDHFREWLGRNGYRIGTLDLSGGLALARPALGKMLDWEGRFGYSLGPDDRNLDALNDGFDFTVREDEGCIVEVLGADRAWQEDPRWLMGLLAIAQSRSREHRALGQRFFVALVLPEHSPLVGAVVEDVKVPAPPQYTMAG